MSKKTNFKNLNQSRTIAPTRPSENSSQPVPQNNTGSISDSLLQSEAMQYAAIPTNNKQTPKKQMSYQTKKTIIKIVIFLVATIICLGLAYIITPKKEKTTDEPKTQENNNNNETNEEKESENEEETSSENELPIVFDETYSFNKGYSKKTTEVSQTSPFVPTAKTGVIECKTQTSSSLISDMTMSIYFYYENNSLKKVIQQNYIAYKDEREYNKLLDTQESSLDEWKEVPGYKLFFINDDTKNTSITGVLLDLSYGPKYSNGRTTITVNYNYDENIAETLKKVYNKRDEANPLTCSALKTSEGK